MKLEDRDKPLFFLLLALIAVGILAVFAFGFQNLTELGTPVSERGQTPFQIISSIGLALIAIVTLALTFWRTSVADKQASGTLEQIKLTREQHKSARQEQMEAHFREAIEMMSREGSTDLSRISGIRILSSLCDEDPELMYPRVINTLVDYISLNTRELADKYSAQLLEIRTRNDSSRFSAPDWPDMPETTLDINEALNVILELRSSPERRNIETDRGMEIAFRSVCVRNLFFEGEDLSGMVFGFGLFENCRFVDCDLTGSTLSNLQGKAALMRNCKVDNANIVLEKDWTIENNHHAHETPPEMFSPDYQAYRSELEESVAEYLKRAEQETDPKEANIWLQLAQREREKIPMLRIRED